MVKPGYIEVRNAGRLLFKYDPQRDIIEIKERGELVYVDLAIVRTNLPGQDTRPKEPIIEMSQDK